MSGLVDFIRARLDEGWRDAQEDHTLGCAVREVLETDMINTVDFEITWREHCDCRARKRLLDIDAKRRILELHGAEPHECVAWDQELAVTCTRYEVECPTLRLFARPYASRPDYKPGWEPGT